MPLKGRHTRKRLARVPHGFTLVEVLVSLVVLSVGMLGIAGLYVAGMRSASGSIYRMQAVNLASDIADRIRANRTANVAYAAAGANNNCVNGGVSCAPGQMAANDLWVWQQQIVTTLPGGAGVIAVAATPSGLIYTYQITVTWVERGEQSPSSYSLNFQL